MGMHLVFAAWYSLSNWPYIGMAAAGLGLVIFVHELGHFLVAKLCGVKCEKFYVGFDVPIKLGWGKYGFRLPASLWKKKWGETVYGIGIIPLGGYVKMLGQDDNPGRQAELMREAQHGSDDQTTAAGEEAAVAAPAIDPRSYMAQTVPERMAIISAGVVMNIIFAWIFATIAFGIGVPYTECHVAYVSPGKPAWMANLRPGDRIVEINGVKQPQFKELQQEVVLGIGDQGVPVVVERTGDDGTSKTLKHTLKPHLDESRKQKLPVIGVQMNPSLELAAEKPTLPGTAADRLKDQVQPGDRLVAVNGRRISSFSDYLTILSQQPDRKIDLTFERSKAPLQTASNTEPTQAESEEVTVVVEPNLLKSFGLVMEMSPITAVQPDSPATRADLRPGDRIVAIDGEPVGDPLKLPDRLRRRAGETIALEIERIGKNAPERLSLTATLRAAAWPGNSDMAFGILEIPSLGIAYKVPAVVRSVEPGSPAANTKILPGDRLSSALLVPANEPQRKLELENYSELKSIPIDQEKTGAQWPQWLYYMQAAQPDTAVKFTVERDEKSFEVTIVPEVDPELFDPERGFHFVGKTDDKQAKSFAEAASLGWRETKYWMLTVYRFLHKLVSGGISPDNLAGPGTIAAVAGISAKQGMATLLIFLTMLSANLAVVNFLPIPVLDGGHMVFLILEGIFRRPVSEKIVIPLTYAGLFLILSLMVYVIGLDVNRFAF